MLIDIHAHMYKYPFPMSYDKEKDEFPLAFLNEEQFVQTYDKLGIDRAVILPIVSAETYMPQSVGGVRIYRSERTARRLADNAAERRGCSSKIYA